MKRSIGKVRDAAERIIAINSQYYPEDLVGVIPAKLLEKCLTDENLFEASIDVDKVRFKKQDEFREILGNSVSLARIINSEAEISGLPADQQRRAKEIKFLYNVAMSILHR